MKPINVVRFSGKGLNSGCIVTTSVSDSQKGSQEIYEAHATTNVLPILFDKGVRNLFIFDYAVPSELKSIPNNVHRIVEDFFEKVKAARSTLYRMIWFDFKAGKGLPFVGFITTISKNLARVLRQHLEGVSIKKVDPKSQEILLPSYIQPCFGDTPIIVRNFTGSRGQENFERIITWFDSAIKANK